MAAAPPQDPSVGSSRAVVCVPTYDEAENITVLLDQVLDATSADVLVIDDNSPDGTAGLVEAHPHFGSRVFLLRRRGKEGLGAAYRAGFAWALDHGYDAVAQMDADLSHPADALPAMLALGAAAGGPADVVIGSRYVAGGGTRNWPWHRQLISRGGNLYVRLLLGIGVRDATAGFRVYTADALQRLHVGDSRSNGYAFQVENSWKASRDGLVIREHPIVFVERQAGSSKMSSRIVREAMLRVLRWRLRELAGMLRRTPSSVA